MLTNPLYYAEQSVARRFIEDAKRLLKKGGRFFLVTRQPDQVEAWITENFQDVDAVARGGYIVFRARTP